MQGLREFQSKSNDKFSWQKKCLVCPLNTRQNMRGFVHFVGQTTSKVWTRSDENVMGNTVVLTVWLGFGLKKMSRATNVHEEVYLNERYHLETVWHLSHWHCPRKWPAGRPNIIGIQPGNCVCACVNHQWGLFSGMCYGHSRVRQKFLEHECETLVNSQTVKITLLTLATTCAFHTPVLAQFVHLGHKSHQRQHKKVLHWVHAPHRTTRTDQCRNVSRLD